MGLTLLLGNIVNWAKLRYTARMMSICSFYYKTHIVILSCVSDDSLPASPYLVRLCVYELRGWGLSSSAGLQWHGQIYDRQLVGDYPRWGNFLGIFIGGNLR